MTAHLPPCSTRAELPFNGNGIPDYLRSALPAAASKPLLTDDRSCLDMAEYQQLGCSCWALGTGGCPLDQPEFCRNCTKVRGKGVGSAL